MPKKTLVEFYDELKSLPLQTPEQEAYCDLFRMAREVGEMLDGALKQNLQMRAGYMQFLNSVQQFFAHPSDGTAKIVGETVKAISPLFEGSPPGKHIQ